jgi:serine/threonine protein kinase
VTETIGQYEIAEQIGAGGMATVYKAYQPKLDRFVAIKLMHQTYAQEANFLSRFEREARIVARLDHPNIVPVYDYDDHNGQPYLVMKFVEGVTLKRVLNDGPLYPDDVLRILSKVGEALQYAHEQGVLHRDIKPSNILLDMRGEPYLTDFGLARAVQSGESTMSADVMLGTPHYISPEQARGETDLDARTDVYSLGIVLYELVTGRVPFVGDTSYGIIHSHLTAPPPPPRDFNPDVTPAVEAVLLKALAKKREERYSTPTELVEAYREAVSGRQISAPPRQIDPKGDRTPQERRPASTDSDPYGLAELGREMAALGQEIGGQIREAFQDFDPKSLKAAGEAAREQGRKRKREVQIHMADKEEKELRQRAEKRIKKRQEELQGLVIHAAVYFFVNAIILSWNPWVAFFWGIGLFAQAWDYYHKYGPGVGRQEKIIAREIERERQRYYNDLEDDYDKRKNEDREPPRVRLRDDGEFTQSFIDELDDSDQRRDRR